MMAILFPSAARAHFAFLNFCSDDASLVGTHAWLRKCDNRFRLMASTGMASHIGERFNTFVFVFIMLGRQTRFDVLDRRRQPPHLILPDVRVPFFINLGYGASITSRLRAGNFGCFAVAVPPNHEEAEKMFALCRQVEPLTPRRLPPPGSWSQRYHAPLRYGKHRLVSCIFRQRRHAMAIISCGDKFYLYDNERPTTTPLPLDCRDGIFDSGGHMPLSHRRRAGEYIVFFYAKREI